MSALRPAPPERLVWLRPEGAPAHGFEAARARLSAWLARGGLPALYAAKRRALYRADDPALGPLALKEVWSGGRLRALAFRRFAPHPALREFRVGAAFAARGGATPPFLAAALERDALRLRRVFLWLRWMEDATTLGAFLLSQDAEPSGALLDAVAASLVAAARLGLVHGRHSGDNLLVTRREGRLEIQVIDFAYAELAAGFDAAGFARDAARVAVTLQILGQLSEAGASRLLDAVAAAWPDAERATRARARLDTEFRSVLARELRAARRGGRELR
jgi:hypothetical protein